MESIPSPPPRLVLTVGACLAMALPTLLAINVPPSVTFFNQVAALVGWGVWAGLWVLLALGRPAVRPVAVGAGALASLWSVLILLAGAVGLSVAYSGLPLSLACTAWGLLAATGVTALFGGTVVRAAWADDVFKAFCVALVAASALNTAIAVIQVFAPQWTDGVWLAGTSAAIAGRAAGNLRQPNHMSSLLLWGLVALVWLQHAATPTSPSGRGPLGRGALGLLLCGGIVLSGSRTGALGLLILAAWGAWDGRLSRHLRWALCCAPVAYALMWWGWSAWAEAAHQAFGGAGRFNLQGDVSASRYAIWSNAWALLRAHPWTGVGWGGFNFAWSLTPFPDRPGAFFDHAHNLALHFAVELGWPLALIVCGLLLHVGLKASRLRSVVGPQGVMGSAALVMLLIMALHSQFEYPLWYTYFLLPSGFLGGFCLALASGLSERSGNASEVPPAGEACNPSMPSMSLLVSAVALTLGASLATLDHVRVVAIFAPAPDAAPLAERIAKGERSVFFSHHAHYAQATTDPDPASALSSIQITAHNLLDTRLMTAWAQACAAQGDVQRARYLTQRLREFGHSKAFFAVCDETPGVSGADLPFQCTAPVPGLTWQDFQGRCQ